MLRTGSVFTEKSEEDGVRVFTAGRLTLDDGKTTHPQIAEGVGFDLWWPELAPESSVYWEWHKGRIDWEEFTSAYLEKLRADDEARLKMAELAGMSLGGRVATILCVEDEPHHCHRRLLADQMSLNFPGIKTFIR